MLELQNGRSIGRKFVIKRRRLNVEHRRTSMHGYGKNRNMRVGGGYLVHVHQIIVLGRAFEVPGLAAGLLQAHGLNLTYTVAALITSVWLPAYTLLHLSQIDLELAGLSLFVKAPRFCRIGCTI